jgi:hypothetical protein
MKSLWMEGMTMFEAFPLLQLSDFTRSLLIVICDGQPQSLSLAKNSTNIPVNRIVRKLAGKIGK